MSSPLTSGAQRARQMLELVGRCQPDLWNKFAQERDWLYAVEPWPSWCYAPLRVVASLQRSQTPFLSMKYTALATWRLTQGVYRVDPTLYGELIRTPLDQHIPVDVLLRLPEWSVYIDLPTAIPTLQGPARGVWVWMEPGHVGGTLLYMLLDTERELETSLADDAMCPLLLKLTKGSLIDALAQTYPRNARMHETFRATAEPILAVLLYLCSQNTDLTRMGTQASPDRPAPVQTRRHGVKIFPPRTMTQWDVGVRIGAALRNAAELAHQDASGQPGGRHPIGHIRRAHWHTILSGPIKNVLPEHRKRDLRWMPPIGVNLPDPDQLLATVRPMKSGRPGIQPA